MRYARCLTRFTMFLLFFASAFCRAQTTATCDHWTFFISFSASGINRWKTVVGTAPQSGGRFTGYIGYANGAVKTYNFPVATQTHFSKRNALGVTVGDIDFSHGLVVTGSSAATVEYPGAMQTILYGINYWDTMVGIFNTGGDFSQPYDGFKMWKNGSVTTIAYPGAMMTNPMSISDTGVIVGWYVNNGAQPPFPYHGFVLANRVYKALDYPNNNRTLLNDINASGVIAGRHINTSAGTQGGFIYVNGTFKDVTAPNVQVLTLNGINVTDM